MEVWKIKGTKFSVAEVWQEIRPKKEKVSWHRLVWGSFSILKHAIIAWLAILDRLPTQDRRLSWGIEVGGNCLLCQTELETRDYLFFGCDYSKSIWERILALCGVRRGIGSWEEELAWAVNHLKGKSLSSTVLRLS